MHGGQQAAAGDGNFQYQDNSTHNYFVNLPNFRKQDLESLDLFEKLINYVKVLFFLISTLVFWSLFGLFSTFPFPTNECIELISCCFKGSVTSKVNEFKNKALLSYTETRSIKELNNFDFQIRLYLGVLGNFDSSNPEGNAKIARFIEALNQQKYRLEKQIKPGAYQRVFDHQETFEGVTLGKIKQDLFKLEVILDESIDIIRENPPSEEIILEVADVILRKALDAAGEVSPSRLSILLGINALLKEMSYKDMSNLNDYERNNAKRGVIDNLREEIRKISGDNKRYSEGTQRKEAEIKFLHSELDVANSRVGELYGQRRDLGDEIKKLNHAVFDKQLQIDQLHEKNEKISRMRVPKGQYIGNLSDKDAKYHFNEKCPHWKMLVAEYVLRLGASQDREIVTSDNLAIFEGMDSCEGCKTKLPTLD